jgi:hypothetical protein
VHLAHLQGFDQIAERQARLGAAKRLILRIRGQEYNRDAQTRVDPLCGLDPIHCPLKMDVHKHKIRL